MSDAPNGRQDVGLAINASDNCDSKLAATLTVWSDEGYRYSHAIKDTLNISTPAR
jgi:hypothetical protein